MPRAFPRNIIAETAFKGKSMDENETDILLMRRIAEDDEAAARELILKWQKPLINFFWRSVNDVHAAEDLAQQTLVKLCRSAAKYEPKAAFSSYLFHIAHNVLVSDFRARSRRGAEPTDPAELPAVAAPDTDLAENELKKNFARAVEALPENQRTAILLLCQQELSYAEIADAMSAPVQNVKNWIHRARQTLRESLAEFLEK